MGRGALILIEGLDRTGKTTQTNNVIEYISNTLKRKVELVKFPERTTPIGKLINQYLTDRSFELSDESAHLLFSANRWELNARIMELLEAGTIVVLDRYVYSGVAYSSAKGMDFNWCLNPDRGLPKPDMTVFLKFKDSANSKDREGFGDERYEVSSFQDKVRVKFEEFERLESSGKHWRSVFVDNKGIDEVFSDVWSCFEKICTDENLGDIEVF